ncbi:MAG: hypothetical protein ACRC28_09535 [Clostridium sp.]|uniref:hypothetical protein n=1 Tax=Clostridium sp. TaxID=1506 RepID=UPI003F33FA49
MSAVLDCLLYTTNPTATSTIDYGQPILFNYDYVIDTTVFNRDHLTGEITILEEGNYLVNWWVVTQTADSARSIGFAIKGRGKDGVYHDYQAAVNPLKTGQISGSSILALSKDEIPFKFQLVNITGYSLGLQSSVVLALDTTAQAGIVVTRVADGGSVGPTGPQGPQGPIGATGLQGERGTIGPIGPTGERGEVGPKGETGIQGITGETGAKGDVGATGAQGDVGPRGDRGPQGIAGPRGSVGPQGPKGERGAQGIQGEVGPAGGIAKISSIENYLIIDSPLVVAYRETINFRDSNVNFVMDGTGIGGNSAINILENGDIELLEAGMYTFNWYLNIEGISQVQYIGFDIIKVENNIPQFEIPLVHSEFPIIIVGQLVGQGMVAITEKTTVRIINSSVPTSDKNGIMSFMSKNNVVGSIQIISYTIGR